MPYTSEDATTPHWSALLSAMLVDAGILVTHIPSGHAAVKNTSLQPFRTYVPPPSKGQVSWISVVAFGPDRIFYTWSRPNYGGLRTIYSFSLPS